MFSLARGTSISTRPKLPISDRDRWTSTIEPPPDKMAAGLALVAQLGIKNLWDILSAPNDYDDGPLLRAKNAAAQTALNAQLRVDENRLRQQQSEDKFAKLLEIIAEEEKRLGGSTERSPFARAQQQTPKLTSRRRVKRAIGRTRPR